MAFGNRGLLFQSCRLPPMAFGIGGVHPDLFLLPPAAGRGTGEGEDAPPPCTAVSATPGEGEDAPPPCTAVSATPGTRRPPRARPLRRSTGRGRVRPLPSTPPRGGRPLEEAVFKPPGHQRGEGGSPLWQRGRSPRPGSETPEFLDFSRILTFSTHQISKQKASILFLRSRAFHCGARARRPGASAEAPPRVGDSFTILQPSGRRETGGRVFVSPAPGPYDVVRGGGASAPSPVPLPAAGGDRNRSG